MTPIKNERTSQLRLGVIQESIKVALLPPTLHPFFTHGRFKIYQSNKVFVCGTYVTVSL
jgi:hypothetical protein